MCWYFGLFGFSFVNFLFVKSFCLVLFSVGGMLILFPRLISSSVLRNIGIGVLILSSSRICSIGEWFSSLHVWQYATFLLLYNRCK